MKYEVVKNNDIYVIWVLNWSNVLCKRHTAAARTRNGVVSLPQLCLAVLSPAGQCLVVQHETRYTVDQALADTWLAEDEQCGRDLATLEEEVTHTQTRGDT